MFTQIITMFTQYFKECQPFFLTFTTGFLKSWHRLNEPFLGETFAFANYLNHKMSMIKEEHILRKSHIGLNIGHFLQHFFI